MAELKREELGQLELEADLAGLKEMLEFMESEEMLTPEQIEAGKNIVGWADILKASVQ